jgi:chitodextrinase
MPTPGAPGAKQSVTVTGLLANTTYYFAIKTADEVPNWSGLSNVFSATTSTAPDLSRPAPLALSITSVTDTTALLGWNATGDDSLTGTAASYDIRYSTSPISESSWATATQVTGEPTPAASGTAQTYLVRNLSRGVRYYFAAKVVDDAGHVSALSNVPNVTTPDTLAPAAITDLAVGWTYIGWRSTQALRPRAPESR